MKNNLSQKIKIINESLIEYFGIPKRNSELPKPIDMLIATILSQNTNDKNSHRAWKKLKAKYKSWRLLLDVPVKELEDDIKIAGLAGQKSKAIIELIRKLFDDKRRVSLNHIKNMIDDEAINYLTNFNGVGLKTASCVLLFSLNRNVCPVDTHVHRVSNRIGLIKTSSPDKTFHQLNKNFPKGIAHSFHTNLIKLGREICKTSSPACKDCPIEKYCKFKKKNFDKGKYKKNDFMLLDNVT